MGPQSVVPGPAAPAPPRSCQEPTCSCLCRTDGSALGRAARHLGFQALHAECEEHCLQDLSGAYQGHAGGGTVLPVPGSVASLARAPPPGTAALPDAPSNVPNISMGDHWAWWLMRSLPARFLEILGLEVGLAGRGQALEWAEAEELGCQAFQLSDAAHPSRVGICFQRLEVLGERKAQLLKSL